MSNHANIFSLLKIPSTLDSLFELLGLVLIFAVVILACYLTTRIVAGKHLRQQKLGNFEVIETYQVAQNRFLQIIRIGRKYVCIAVGKDSVEPVCELSEEDVVKLNQDQQPSGLEVKETFQNILNRFKKNKDENKNQG